MVICVAKGTPPPGCELVFTTIQAGLDAAAAGNDRTVVVSGNCGGSRCVYQENVRFPAGGIALVGAGYPIIDGGGKGRTVEFYPGSGDPSSISGFEIIGGKLDGENGAGVYAKDASVTIMDNCIHDNVADEGTGGGICIEFSAASPVYTCQIQKNSIYNNRSRHGAGVGVRGLSDPSRSMKTAVTISQNVIGPSNAAVGTDLSYGGGVSIYKCQVVVDSNEIHNNKAKDYGGGVATYNLDRDSSLVEIGGAVGLFVEGTPKDMGLHEAVLSGNLIHDNTAWKGGGVSGLWSAVIEYTNNIIEKNFAETRNDPHGGGIYGTTAGLHKFGSTNLIKENYTKGGNDGRGGGIHASCDSVLYFTGDNLLVGNKTDSYGGGVSLDNADMVCAGGRLYIADNAVQGGGAGGLGGGIYMCSSDSTDGGANVKWQPCNHNNTLALKSAIVERNSAPVHGAGIAVEKLFTGVGAVVGNVSIDGCVIRGNIPGSATGEGVYFSRSEAASSSDIFSVTDSLVSGHTSSGKVAGIRIADTFGPSRFISNLLTGNDLGIDLGPLPNAKVESNHFLRNLQTQLQITGGNATLAALDGSLQIASNGFDGRHSTPLGVVLTGFKGQSFQGWNFLTGNDIYGHTLYGLTSDAPSTPAQGNWWGSAGGPTLPDGTPAGGGDKISTGVEAIPFNKTSSFQPKPAPNLQPPASPVLSTPRPIVCEAQSSRKPDHPPPPTRIITHEPPNTLREPEYWTVPQPEETTPSTQEKPPPTSGGASGGGTGSPTPGTPPSSPAPSPSPASTPIEPPKRRSPKTRWLIIIGVIVAIVLIGTTAFLAFPPAPPGASSVTSSTTIGIPTSSSHAIITTTTQSSPSTAGTSMQGYVTCPGSALAFVPQSSQSSCFFFGTTPSSELASNGSDPSGFVSQQGGTAYMVVYAYGSGSVVVSFSIKDTTTGQTIASGTTSSEGTTIGGTGCGSATQIAVTGSLQPGLSIAAGQSIEFTVTFYVSGGGGTVCMGGSTPTGFQIG